MDTSNNQPAQDKLHSNDLGETKDFDNLSYDKNKKSYEYDVKGEDKDYDHPMNYETVPAGAVNDDSTYDEANPYVGDEYAGKEEMAEDELNELGMHVDDGDSVLLTPEDKILSKTDEDYRDDLDDEGYPKNDSPVGS